MQCSGNRKLRQRQSGFSLLELLISNAVLVVIFAISTQHVIVMIRDHAKQQLAFQFMHARLLAQYFLKKDLATARLVSYSAGQLIIQNDQVIVYDLRDSVIPHQDPRHALALYRTDGVRRAEALVEGLVGWQISQDGSAIKIVLHFKDQQRLEIKRCLSSA